MVKGTIYLVLGQVVFAITTLIIHAFLGRKLGPEEYGVFGLINSLIVLNEVLLSRSTTEGISRFVATEPGSIRSIMDWGIKLQTCVGIIMGFSLFCFSTFLSNLFKDLSISDYFKMIAILIPITSMSSVYIGALNGTRSFWKQSNVWIGSSLTRLGFVIVFVSIGLRLTGVIIAFILSGVFQLWISKRYCNSFRDNGFFDGKQLSMFILQLFWISVFTAILMNVDIFAIKYILMDDRLTGLYTSAITISRVPFLFLSPLTLSMFPSIAKAQAEHDYMQISEIVERALRYLLIAILPCVVVIMATSRELLTFIYGKSYIDASVGLQILAGGIIFHVVKVIMYNVIVASGSPYMVIITGGLSVILDVTLIITLIGRFYLTGVALAATITSAVGCVVSVVYVLYRFKTNMKLSSIIRICGASGIIYVYISFTINLGVPLLIIYLLAFVLYIVLLASFKEISKKDVEAFAKRYNITSSALKMIGK